MSHDAKKTVRFAALQALERIQKGGAYSNLLLNEEIKKKGSLVLKIADC